ncbi:MAG: PEP-CTERM sorting domain-containing protein [Leptodesmis sp.]
MNAASAEAFSFSVGGTAVSGEGYMSSVLGATTINFNSGDPNPSTAFVTFSGLTDNIVQGSIVNNYATPLGNTTHYLTISNVGSGKAGATGSVTLNFASALDYFGLYWGSVDPYNSISFFNGDTLLATFTGNDVSTTASGSWVSATDNLYANFFAGHDEAFNKVVLSSTGIAFESDNFAYRAAPEPLTLGGTAIGLALGARMRKKMKAKAA